MDLPKAYNPADYEDAIYKRWESSGAFSPDQRSPITDHREPFVITMPPPNATGQLHMGHAAMLAVEDLMVRYHRMKGDATLWVPGTDHAGIATQNMAEKLLLKEKGKTRHDLGREKFVEYTRDFAERSKDTIRKQVRKMGTSCDWTRERYTLDEHSSKAVNAAFVKMYNDDLIYRGFRIVNWCTRCYSTLSDDEVVYIPEKTKFYYLKYGPVIIGTARPETKFGDKVIIVHPKDKRYKKYVGKELTVPWIMGDIEATFIADESADMELGSGAMTITPGHSFVDFDLAQKYGLEVQKIIDEHGRITEHGGPEFHGLSTKEAREKVVARLYDKGLVERIDENYEHNLSVCYRCKTPIEPLPSEQWFVAVNKKSKQLKGKTLKQRASEVVKKHDITILPERFEKIYFHWMDNLRDWCISRQIWWGHRIPAWKCVSCNEWTVAADTPKKCNSCSGTKLEQDHDTLDTWFSASLWTFSTLGWPEETDDLKKFHPTSVMETGYDILFFWVARMIIMTTYHLGEIPFKTVYLHGLVRDRDGDKMSKSKPETMIDPLDVCEKYGTDAVRLSLVIGTSPGGDMRLFDEKIAGYRNFTNKVWNVARFILMNTEEASEPRKTENDQRKTLPDRWILSRTQRLIEETTTAIEEFRFSEGGTKVYEFLWNDLADWYLEMSKVERNDAILHYCLETVLKLLHPWMPFVTEEIWKSLVILRVPQGDSMLMTEQWPSADKSLIDATAEKDMQSVIDVVNGIRSLRSDAGIDPAKKVTVIIVTRDQQEIMEEQEAVIRKLARAESLTITDQKPTEKSLHKTLNGLQIYIPADGLIDLEKELQKTKEEMRETETYIQNIDTKLKNKAFVEKAPAAVVEQERGKLEQAAEKLKRLAERLGEFS